MSENKPVLVALVVTGLALVGFVIYYFASSPPEPESVVQPVAVVPAPVEPPQEVIEPDPLPVVAPEPIVEVATPEEEPPAFILPRLDGSDQLIRDGAMSLTRNEGINRWLAADELIRKSVTFVDNIANGTIAKEPAAALAPEGPMIVKEVSEGVYVMDERSYDRYDAATNILLSIDSKRAVEFYLLLKPLFAEAYAELGYPSGNFDQVTLQAIGRLLETPTLDEPAKLVRPVVMYEYQDENLESLSPAQKQLLRLGPQHGAKIKAKLSEIARELRAAG